ncbi:MULTISPECIES: hypothetical protein [unclassified Mycobacterium]|uniref:hypothetical protein n=1 Tax=unclassified Mycobacterium TaxID=2642494 RepID=UPI0029C7731D|nr:MULTISPECIES: hypothetical protein [unclassified Mycobacterium]
MRALTEQRLHIAVGPTPHEAPPAVGEPPAARRGLRSGRPPRSVWRERARSRLSDLQVQLDELPPDRQLAGQCREARRQLEEALKILDTRPQLRGMWNGIDVEATWVRIHSIDAAVIRLADPQVVKAKLPSIVADGGELLGKDNRRVATLREYVEKPEWDRHARESIAHSVRAVYEASDSENVRLRSFRNLLFGATLALALIAVGLAFVDVTRPSALGLSAAMTGNGADLSSRGNIVVVELLGLVSASLVGALSLRRMQGTSSAYAVPMATMLLKLPAGALAAVAGLLMIKAGIVGPSVSASSSAHVMGYALLLGASQHSITGLVDRQAQKVLNGVSSKDNA